MLCVPCPVFSFSGVEFRWAAERKNMKESAYKSYDELPLFLNAETVAKVLGISPSSGYELMHEKDFPALKIGNRIVVPKEEFIQWVKEHTGGER